MLTTALFMACSMTSSQEPARPAPADDSATLASPTLVRAGGAPIDVAVGHASPLLHDWDGDGKLDLLVGQFGKGLLGVYPNLAEAGAPLLGERVWAMSEQAKLKVPTG